MNGGRLPVEPGLVMSAAKEASQSQLDEFSRLEGVALRLLSRGDGVTLELRFTEGVASHSASSARRFGVTSHSRLPPSEPEYDLHTSYAR